MSTQYLKTSEVKKIAHNLNMRISKQVIIDSNRLVGELLKKLLKKAAYRAKENRRKTIMPRDL